MTILINVKLKLCILANAIVWFTQSNITCKNIMYTE